MADGSGDWQPTMRSMNEVAQSGVAESLARVRERIALAAGRAGRDPAEVTLVAVSKTKPAEAVREALAAGQQVFGENRVQEALEKIELLGSRVGGQGEGPDWHLIGHLQTNKARFVPGHFSTLESLDSPKLARALQRQCAETATGLDVYLQLNLDEETTKSGVTKEDDVRALLECVLDCPNLRPLGLMTLPDPALDETGTRRSFARMREELAHLQQAFSPGADFKELSMGMSHDFEWAIEEGATLVRVGSAIFGARP